MAIIAPQNYRRRKNKASTRKFIWSFSWEQRAPSQEEGIGKSQKNAVFKGSFFVRWPNLKRKIEKNTRRVASQRVISDALRCLWHRPSSSPWPAKKKERGASISILVGAFRGPRYLRFRVLLMKSLRAKVRDAKSLEPSLCMGLFRSIPQNFDAPTLHGGAPRRYNHRKYF